MFYIGDLFQWERFITPSIIKLFYWLVVIMVLLAGLSGLVTALGTFFVNPIAGALYAIASFAGMLVGILFARIVAEFILMVFRINEHLAAIRNRGGCRGQQVRTCLRASVSPKKTHCSCAASLTATAHPLDLLNASTKCRNALSKKRPTVRAITGFLNS